MRRLSFIVALFAGSFVAEDAAAQDWREMVLRQLDSAGEAVRQVGQTDANVLLRNQVIGMLEDGGTSYIEVGLEEGVTYVFAGACDQDCSDLDLRLVRAEDFETVESDIELDDVPIVSFTPPVTASYLVGVDMADCSQDVCYYGFRAYRE